MNPATTANRPTVQARRAGFFRDVISIAIRALRSIPRDPEAIYPALIIPVFFYAINIGALQDMAENIPGLDYKAFQLPVAIIFAVTGISRAVTLVTDIQTGYFDRLALTPVNRLALLLGLTVADFTLVVALTLPVIAIGLIVGVTFASGILGLLLFILLSGLWGLVFTGFPYAIAFKTGNPAAVNSSFLLFFPFVFLTTVFVPKEAMTGWLSTVATLPRNLPARRPPLPDSNRLGCRSPPAGRRLHRRSRRRKRNFGPHHPPRPHPQEIGHTKGRGR